MGEVSGGHSRGLIGVNLAGRGLEEVSWVGRILSGVPEER